MSNTETPTNTSILADLNVTIADVETLSCQHTDSVDLKRSVGQLKAARASFIAFIHHQEAK
jgi:hypothetical protein